MRRWEQFFSICAPDVRLFTVISRLRRACGRRLRRTAESPVRDQTRTGLCVYIIKYCSFFICLQFPLTKAARVSSQVSLSEETRGFRPQILADSLYRPSPSADSKIFPVMLTS